MTRAKAEKAAAVWVVERTSLAGEWEPVPEFTWTERAVVLRWMNNCKAWVPDRKYRIRRYTRQQP